MPEKVALTGTEEANLQPFLAVTSLDGKPLTMEGLLRNQGNAADRHPEGGREEVAAARRRMGNRDTERPYTGPHALCVCCQYNHSRKYPSVENGELHTGDHCLPAGRYESDSRANKEISNACGKVVFSYQPTKEGMKVTRSLRISRQLQTPSSYKELYALLAEWRDANNHTLVVKKVAE